MPDFETWYKGYHRRIYDWTSDCSVRSAGVVLMLPDLVRLLLDLSADTTLPPTTRQTFQDTAAHIMEGMEYLPEGVLGTVGLIEDAVKIAKQLNTTLPDLNTPHWHGDPALPDAIRYLLNNQDDFASRC